MSLLGNYSDLQAAQIALQDLLTGICSNPLDSSNALLEQEFTWVKTADDTNATDATAEFVIASVSRRCKLVSADFTPNGTTNLATAAANNATVTFGWRAGTTTGGASGTLMTVITTVTTSGGTGNWSQWVPVSLGTPNAFDPTNTAIPAGGTINLAITKNSSGVVVPKGTARVRIQYL